MEAVYIQFSKMSKKQLIHLRDAVAIELKTRASKRVDTHTFVVRLIHAFRGNYNAEWLANDLGMKVNTVKSRIRNLEKEWVKMVELGQAVGPFPYKLVRFEV